MTHAATRTLPLVDLARQYRTLKPEILSAVARVLASGIYITGPEVAAFEREAARFCTTRYAVSVASGTDALELALRAVGVGPGDEVITTPLTFIATVEAIIEVGARPVLVDIDPVTYTLDPALMERRITRRTKAVIPVHLYGQPADLTAFTALARRHHVHLIEDCAQAIGATFRGRRVGSVGVAGCFSFYPAKNLGAYGDGGLVVTSRRTLAERIRMLRVHGSPVHDRYRHVLHGMNSRLDELHAAMLRVKLRRLARWNAARRRVARWYTTALLRKGVSPQALPRELPGRNHVYHLYVVRTRHRAALQAACARAGIATGIHYPVPLHLQPALRWLGYRRGAFPHSERAAKEAVSLPLFPEMTRREVMRVANVVHSWLLP